MNLKYLLLSVQEKVATVTINWPDKGNALAPDVLEEIEKLFTELGAREDVNAIVFTGGEKYFSAGFDLNEIRKLKKVSNEAYTALFHKAYRAILFCPQPVICAIGGAAIAEGFDLTMMCDIRYASERAKEVALTGIIYDAFEAEKMGYVKRVFPAGRLLEPVIEIAREMATSDRGCLKETKQLANKVLNEDLDGAMRLQE